MARARSHARALPSWNHAVHAFAEAILDLTLHLRGESSVVDPGIAQELCSVSFGAEELILFGTEEQKERWMKPLASGRQIAAFALTEPQAGSDAGTRSEIPTQK